MTGPPVVLPLGATGRTPADRHPELLRLFGTRVHVQVAVLPPDVSAVAAAVVRHQTAAVLADTWRGDPAELAAGLAPLPVLRPIFQARPGSHAGPPTKRFAGYQQVTPTGEHLNIADGALSPT